MKLYSAIASASLNMGEQLSIDMKAKVINMNYLIMPFYLGFAQFQKAWKKLPYLLPFITGVSPTPRNLVDEHPGIQLMHYVF